MRAIKNFFILSHFFLGLCPGASVYEDRFLIGSDTFRIKAKVTATTEGYGPAVRVDYTVYRNNKTMLPSHEVGGILRGCRYGSLPTKSPLERVQIKGKTVGWLIEVLGVCGNTTSLKNHLVIPAQQAAYHGQNLSYGIDEFVSKQKPLLREMGKKIEVWYTYQEWGNGGTAGSFFVPQKLEVEPQSGILIHQRIDSLPKSWPKLQDVDNFASLFVAGLVDKNAELIAESIKKFDVNQKDTYAWMGLPTSKAQVQSIQKLIKEHGDLLNLFLKKH